VRWNNLSCVRRIRFGDLVSSFTPEAGTLIGSVIDPAPQEGLAFRIQQSVGYLAVWLEEACVGLPIVREQVSGDTPGSQMKIMDVFGYGV